MDWKKAECCVILDTIYERKDRRKNNEKQTPNGDMGWTGRR